MTLVERIRSLCKKRRITLAELERIIGLGNGVIGRWEERTPASDKLLLVADYFDVSVDYLLGRARNKKAIILEGDALPDELKGLDIKLEVIQEIAGSGLSAKQIQHALKLYRLYEKEYGDGPKE